MMTAESNFRFRCYRTPKTVAQREAMPEAERAACLAHRNPKASLSH
jgi:hypothetical protein